MSSSYTATVTQGLLAYTAVLIREGFIEISSHRQLSGLLSKTKVWTLIVTETPIGNLDIRKTLYIFI